jgi:hypothetical protein
MKTKYKITRDKNGNKRLSIKYGDKRATSIQTNGNLPRTHQDGIGDWTASEVESFKNLIIKP